MSSLLLDLARGALPHVPLNKGVLQANTDTFLDALPLLTMLPCLSVSCRRRHRRRSAALHTLQPQQPHAPQPMQAGHLPIAHHPSCLAPRCRCCAPQTLLLYWRRRRYVDFALFLTGFTLALIYHWLHMHPEARPGAVGLAMAGGPQLEGDETLPVHGG